MDRPTSRVTTATSWRAPRSRASSRRAGPYRELFPLPWPAVRTAIIGYGLSGRIFHAPFIAADPRFSIEAISTSDPGRRAQAAQDHPEPRSPGRPRNCLRSASTSWCSPRLRTCTSSRAWGARLRSRPRHRQALRRVRRRGRAARRSGDLGRTATHGLPEPPLGRDFLTVRKLIREGALGQVHRFESTFERWSPEVRKRWQDTTTSSQGAGIVFDLGSHLVDQALQLFGPATLTAAELSIVRPGSVSADDAFLSLLHDSGTRSHLTMSRFAAQSGPRFRVLGSIAGYKVDGLDGQEPALLAGASPADAEFGLMPEEAWARSASRARTHRPFAYRPNAGTTPASTRALPRRCWRPPRHPWSRPTRSRRSASSPGRTRSRGSESHRLTI